MNVSVKTTARIGGLLYLINIIVGFFAIGYVPGVIISNNAVTTAQNMQAHETLYRLGLTGHVIILLTNFPLALIFYRLFKNTNKGISLLVIFFTLAGTTIECSNLLNQFAPLLLLNGKSLIKEFTSEQLSALGYFYHRLQDIGVNLAFVFFGFYGLCIGYLIIRSGFLPKAIGVFMVVGGTCYIVNSFTSFLAPVFASHLFPYILMPSGLAELSLCLWLLIAGVNTKRWEEKVNLNTDI